jgi:GTPase SAR1 family protein
MADELKDIYHLFNPDKALLNDELGKYYVEIDQNETNIKELQIRLELGLETREPIKLLFTGHRGSGKSTALNRLILNLDSDFIIVKYNVLDLLDQNDVTYIDVLLSILTKLFEKAQEDEVKLEDSLSKRADEWSSSITKTRTTKNRKGLEFKAKIPFYLLEIMGRIKNESTTRKEIRKQIEPRVSELISLINDTIAEIEKNDKQILVIIDNLEKIESDNASELFYNHGTQLSQPMCKIIYTFPISLKSSDKFQQIKNNFSGVYVHPNIKIHEKDGSEHHCEKGREFMKEIVSKRVSLELFEPDALEYILDMSGGVVREFIRIIRDSSIRALARGKITIDKDIAIDVVNGLKNLYQAQLSDSDYKVLLEVYKTKDIKRDDKLVNLLHNLSVLEYRNGRSWCDLNPVVRSILDEKNML